MRSTKQRLLAALLCAVMALGLCIPVGAAPAMLGEDYTVAEIPVEDGAFQAEVRTSTVERPSLDTQDQQASLQAAGGFLNAVGQKESAYATWEPATGVSRYSASVIDASGKETALDDALIRSYPGYMRVDALGLKAGKYKIKVTPNTGAAMTTEELTVTSYDRSGYAFENGHAPGAYNADGTLKPNTKVVYITQDTASTVKLGVDVNGKGTDTEVTGLPGILLAYKKKKETDPLCIRVIGTVANDYKGNLPGHKGAVITGTSHDGSSTNLNDTNFKGDLTVKDCMAPVTIEGVGNDAVLYGIGLRFMNANDLEVRNLGFMNCNSDEADSIGFQPSCTYVWVHNTDIFYGMKAGDADQAKGDGSLDTKGVKYATLSYNHFWDAGKANLCGLDNNMDYMTYHHNWYDHSDSRHPRVRYTAHCHVYNNYYDDNAKYGVGGTTGSSIFVENNYFRNCPKPMLISMQGSDIAGGNGTFSSEDGGMIKSSGNIILGADKWAPYSASNTVEFDAYDTAKNEKVPADVKTKKGGTSYNNFDTASDFYTYKLDKADDVPNVVKAEAGRQGGSDFDYQIPDNSDVWDSEHKNIQPTPELANKINSYEPSLVRVGGSVDGSSGGEHTHVIAWRVKTAPSCNKDTQALIPGVEEAYCTICQQATGQTREVPGQHTDANGDSTCDNCGADLSSGGSSGGTVTPSNPGKVLKGSDFKMTAPLTDGKKSALGAEELAAVADGYFTMEGAVNKRISQAGSVGDTVQFFDLSKSSNNGIKFTVSAEGAPATMTASFSSSGKTNTSTLILVKADGTSVNTDKGAAFTAHTGLDQASVTYKDLAAGTYIIKGSTDGGAASDARLYSVTVSEKVSETPVAVTGVSLNKTTAEVKVGGTVTLTATVAPSNAGNKKVTWESSDETVATVSANGVVTGKKVGNATITVTTVESGFTATCAVTVAAGAVEPTPVDKTALNKTIADATAAKAGVVTSEQGGKDVDKTIYWVTTAQLQAMNKSIADAEAVATNAAATQDLVDSATSALTATLGVFKGQKALGTKEPVAAGTTKVLTADDVLKALDPSHAAGKDFTGTAGQTYTTADGFFTVYPKNTGTAYDAISIKAVTKWGTATWADYTPTYAFNGATGSSMTQSKDTTTGVVSDRISNVYGFTVDGPATVKVWYTVKASTDADGVGVYVADQLKAVYKDLVDTAVNKGSIATVSIPEGGTYYVGGTKTDGSGAKIVPAKIEVTISSGETPVVIDKTALNKAIADAAAAKVGVVTSADGKDVDKTIYWVIAAQLKTLNDAITDAEKVASAASTTQTAVDAAAKALNDAVTAFKGQKALGTKDDKPTPPTGVTVTGVTIQKDGAATTTASVAMGKTLTLTATATVTGTGATDADKAVTWSSSDEKVATVKDGVVTPVGAGTAEIVATSVKDASKSAKVTLSVTKGEVKLSIQARNVGIDAAGGSILLRVDGVPAGASATVTITPTTGGAKVEACNENDWNYKATLPANPSEKDDVAYEVTAAFAGDANWAAATAVKTTIYVRHVGAKVIKLTKVPGGGTGKVEVALGAKLELAVEATVTPEGTLKYEWLKDGKTIAGATSATYTKASATAEDAGEYLCRVTCEGAVEPREAKVTVSVTGGVAVESVSLSTDSTNVYVGRTIALKATVKPENATNKAVKWSSNDETIATVDANGVITGKKAGTTTITVTTLDGGKSATCKLTVITSGGGGGGGGGGGSKPSGGSGGSSGGTTTPKPTGLPFVDVADSAWYHDSVRKVYDKGLMKGTDATHFTPNQNTSRAMVATVLYRLDGEKTTEVKAAFRDVADGSWYAKAVEWAAAKGVVKGYDANTFAPDDNVTREQLAVMLYRYAAPAQKSTKDLSAFADAAAVSDWALEAVTWAVDKGIMNGKGNGNLDPKGLASRAEICAMMVRFTELDK